MPVTKVKVNGEWIPAMPVGGEGDMTKAVYDTNDDGVVNAADQATKDGNGNVITSTYAAKATTLSGYGITDAKIENGVITLGSNTITPLTSVPVASVNGQTGTVVLDADDVGALPDNTPIPEFFEIEIAYIDSEEDYSLKTSASDIVAAYNAGKTIVGKYTGYESTSSVSPYFTCVIATIYANYDSYENGYYFKFWDMSNTYEVVCWDDDGTLTASLDHYPGQFVTYQTVQDNVPNMQVYPTAYCETGGSYKTKIAKCTNWAAAANTYIHVLMKYGNITSNALTLNINNTGSKPIYINGTVSSSNNKALPAGSYLVFYNGVNFYFRTDGVLPQPTGYGDSVNPYTSKLANYILAGPTSGSAAAPSFRALVAADIPTLTASKLSDVSISNGTITIGSNSITPLTSFTESDPIFTASAAYGISSSDITNWNNKVSDTKTWGDVVAPDSRSDTSDNRYIPQFSATSSSSGTTATFTLTRVEPFSLGVPKWDYSNYLYAATPTSTDNSTKVATTAFVQTALGGYIASDTTANFTISDTAPSNPQTGDLWLDTNSQSASGIAYLPLSAGSNHPLSGDLYIDTESGTEYKIVFDENGTEIGKIGMSSDGTMRFWRLDSGNAACGVQCNTSTLNLFASGSGYIVLRPNGVNNQTGETSIDPSGWMNGKGFHATAIASDQVNRMGDMFFYRKSNISGGAMTAGTLKTIDTIATASYRPNGDVDTGFAIGYNKNSVLPLRYGYVRIKADGSVQVSPNESVASSCYWTIIAIWRNPNYT